jgi:spore germination cell wall hydrolase CwlJ-like protein
MTTQFWIFTAITGMIAGYATHQLMTSEPNTLEVIPLADHGAVSSINLLATENRVLTASGEVLKHDDDLVCLANNIYFESRNQPLEGQLAVGYATLNRVGKFGNRNVCDAVTNTKYTRTGEIKRNACHFSWMCDQDSTKVVDDQQAYANSRIVAKWVLNRKQPDPTGGADHYLTKTVENKTYWVKAMDQKSRKVIGDHVFYKSSNKGV